MERILRQKRLLSAIWRNENRELILRAIKNFQKLREAGKTDQEINQVIQEMKMPLPIHLFITANFSDLMGLKIV